MISGSHGVRQFRLGAWLNAAMRNRMVIMRRLFITVAEIAMIKMIKGR